MQENQINGAKNQREGKEDKIRQENRKANLSCNEDPHPRVPIPARLL